MWHVRESRSLMRRRSARVRTAFTLVELMVVVVIIGIMATVVTVKVTDYLVTGKQNAARSEIAQIVSALELFYTEFDRYPANDEGLEVLTQSTAQHPNGVLRGDLLDPWGNAYIYVYPGVHGTFDVVSYGANKTEGGTGGHGYRQLGLGGDRWSGVVQPWQGNLAGN